MFDMVETQLDPVGNPDPVLQIRMGLAALAGEDRGHWTGDAVSELVVELLEVQERLGAEVLRLVGRWHRSRAWEADGSLSAVSWLEARAPVASRDARRLVKTARLVDQHRALGDALADGDITVGHADAVARVTSKDREPLLTGHAPVLAEQAATLPISEFVTVMRRWASLADDALATDSHERQYERRHLYASVSLNGWVAGEFHLDPATGRSFIDVLDHLAPPDPVDTPEGSRTLSQRRADALADLVDHHRNGTRPRGNPPHLSLIVDVAALPTTDGAVTDLGSQLTARRELDGIGPIDTATFEHLACCATITPVFVKSKKVILDMGRRRRLATRTQLRALTIRDRHCRFGNCRRPARWCDAHHIISWLDLGPTDLNNLVLLCRRHHTLIHTTRWTITLNPATGEVTISHPARANPTRGP